MTVSWRYILSSAAVLVGAALSATAAQAQCCAPPPPKACCAAPSGPKVFVPGVNVGGPNISVGGSSFNGGSVSVTTNVGVSTGYKGGFIAGGAISQQTFIGGGGALYAPSAVAPGVIEGLNVIGGEAEKSITRTREATFERIVQAVCIDDRGMPHPASRVNADEAVPATFRGEVFRCMAGTAMQVTLGRLENGRAVFDGGETIACAKGEALVHADGRLTCRAQTQEASCNERSLLRRYGPGLKRITLRTVETYQEKVTETVKLRNLTIDGGVGQGVF